MQDGTSCDVEILCRLFVTPVHGRQLEDKIDKEKGIHLTTTKDETLLRRWYTGLLLYFLLDPRDLPSFVSATAERRMYQVPCLQDRYPTQSKKSTINNDRGDHRAEIQLSD